MSDQVWATRFPPPPVPGTKTQQRRLLREVERLDLSKRMRAVLIPLCDFADGAGFSYPKIESAKGDTTLCLRSGQSVATTRRALTDLRAEELVETWAVLRGKREGHRREHRSRYGVEQLIFRVGSRLRRAADLHEVDVVEHLGLRGPNERAEIPPIPLQVRPSRTLEAERARTENGRPLFEGSVRLGETLGEEQGQERNSTERLLAIVPERELQDEGETNDDRFLAALPDLTKVAR